jgi:hypothetical protein
MKKESSVSAVIPLTEERHAYIAHDLPLVADLLCHHCIFISAAYSEAKEGTLRQIAALSVRVCQDINSLVKEMAKVSAKEYPGAKWLTGYAEHQGTNE